MESIIGCCYGHYYEAATTKQKAVFSVFIRIFCGYDQKGFTRYQNIQEWGLDL